jgi:Zn-dependent protease
MKWSYRIARVAGIDIRLHVTFLLLPALFGFLEWRTGGLPAATWAVVFILLLFVCILLHEFGHALAGRRFGIRTPDITLLPIGGVARMAGIPAKPGQEFVIAVAGPAVNIAIGGALALPLLMDSAYPGERGDTHLMLWNLMIINFGLVLFNMIPAFPMDGGRVLRSLLAMRMGHLRATRIAARLGQVLAILFGVAGFFYNPMLVLIALFVFGGAKQELADAEMRDAMQRSMEFEIIPPPPPPR